MGHKYRIFSTKEMNVHSVQGKTYSTHECVIENFSKMTGKLKSDRFYLDNNKSQPWSLRFHPDGDRSESKGYVSIFLWAYFDTIITTKVRIFLLDSNENEIRHSGFVHTYTGKGWGYTKFVERDKLFKRRNGLHLNDSLTLLCKIKVVDSIKSIGLTDDFRKAFGVIGFSDVTLSVDDKEFKLHKFILAARSPVFAAMFKHPMEEATTNMVKIPDVSPAVMDEVIRYLYTDETPKLEEMVEGILPVADKYDLKTLKEMCEEELNFQLIVSNAVHILELADLYNLDSLKEDAIDLIEKNIKDLMMSPRWKALTTSKSDFIIRTLSAIVINLLNITL